jgi:adenylate cyclase
MGFVTRHQVDEAVALQPLTGSRVGEALVSLGYLTSVQLQRALARALSDGVHGVLSRPPLGEVLMGLGSLSETNLEAALEEQKVAGKKLGEILVARGVLGIDEVEEALSLQRRMSNESGILRIPAVGTKRRVMVIDDSSLACDMVEDALRGFGFEVATFTDAHRAIEVANRQRPDVVLTDLEMPGLDGEALCRRLKGLEPSLPVIILTANDSDLQRVSGLKAGADDYVSKGASMAELAARIETVLRRTSETERIRKLFAQYTSDAVVEQVMRLGNISLAGERREITSVFVDLRNFTAFAESTSPEEVMSLLNGVLGRLADLVLKWGGTLDKFLGDGLMAIWGAPIAHADDVTHAVSCAVEMGQSVRARNRELPHEVPVEIGIGVNTGPAIFGQLGSQRRMEMTCIGDSVNVASRLCALAGPGEILLGESTASRVDELSPSEKLSPVRVKGKLQPVALSRVTPELVEAILKKQRR